MLVSISAPSVATAIPSTWRSIATGLGLCSLLLAACDLPDAPDEPEVANSGTTESDPSAGDTEPDSADGPEPGETETAGEPPAEACSEQAASRACTTEDGEAGTQFCDGAWGPCLTQVTCTPGEEQCCEGWESTGEVEDTSDTEGTSDTASTGDTEGTGGTGDTGGSEGSEGSEGGGGDETPRGCAVSEICILVGGVPDWNTNQGGWDGCNTPLVLSFDGAPAELEPARAATFDLDVNGGCITSDWPAAATPWLALDVDGNGTIDSGRELFGSGTRLRSGAPAPHGFAALAELDDDGDGRIDPSDEAFSQLVLWGDHDGDRRSTFAEAQPLPQHRILSIELGYHIDRQCDARGNCAVERAAFHFVDEHGAVRQGEVVDLHLACQ